jgi:hypothetical protein
MSANAPQAIWDLWYRIRDLWKGPGQQDEELSGIVGDALHSFGFHLSPNELRAAGKGGDYSLQGTRNSAGAVAYPDDASALDVHFGPAGMITATSRLLAAAKARDPRMGAVFEFCGTTNGSNPHPYYLATHQDDPNNTGGWSDSHLTHCHFSFWRDVSHNFDALKGVADVIAGIPLIKEFTMDDAAKAAFAALNKRLDATDAKFDALAHAVWAYKRPRPTPADQQAEPQALAYLMRAAAAGTPVTPSKP